tara:strand:+ start:2416 stop:3243 length:828 start_codon:yes stop_codon:yes gene_type:complete
MADYAAQIAQQMIENGFTPKTMSKCPPGEDPDEYTPRLVMLTYIRIHKIPEGVERPVKEEVQAAYRNLTSTPKRRSTFLAIEVNDKPGPLSLAQKLHIRDQLSNENAQELAEYINTNVQNVRLAQQGKFVIPDSTPPESIRPYGPLTVKEKIHIHTYEADEPTSFLASKYNTAYINIQRAQTGQFRIPQAPEQRTHKRPFGPLSIEDKVEIRDYRSAESPSALADEYNTHASNIVVAQKGRFVVKGTVVTLQHKYDKILKALEEHNMLHIIEGLW